MTTTFHAAVLRTVIGIFGAALLATGFVGAAAGPAQISPASLSARLA